MANNLRGPRTILNRAARRDIERYAVTGWPAFKAGRPWQPR